MEEKIILFYMTFHGTGNKPFNNLTPKKFQERAEIMRADLKLTAKKYNRYITTLWRKGVLGFQTPHFFIVKNDPSSWEEILGEVENLLVDDNTPKKSDNEYPDWVKTLSKQWRQHAIQASGSSAPPKSWEHRAIADSILSIVEKEKLDNFEDISTFVFNDDFWKNNCYIPASLMKRNKDGVRKFDHIKKRMQQMNIWKPSKQIFTKENTEKYTGKAIDALGRVIEIG